MSFIIEYLKGVKTEAKHVTWPNRRDTILFTVVVLAISIIGAFYLGLLDFVFSIALKFLIA